MKAKVPPPKPEVSRHKIIIVDDHPVVREGLAAAINAHPEFTVCATAGNPEEACAAVEKTKPDAAVVDLSLEGQSGMGLIKDLKIRYPKLPVIVLSMHDEELYSERVLRAGAQGYLMKKEPIEVLIQALRRVVNGEIHLSEKMKDQLVRNFSGHRPVKTATLAGLLSDRELEVFQLISQGLGTSQIAERLSLSMKTVSSYRQNIKLKLKLSTGNDVVRYAIEWARSNRVE